MYLRKISNYLENIVCDYNNRRIKNIIFYSFCLLIIVFLILTFFSERKIPIYAIQELMINYADGFVRRGLPGSVLMFLIKQYNINLLYRPLMLLSFIMYLLFAFLYAYLVKKSQKVFNSETLIIILFLPSLVLFPINELNMMGRKEFLFFFGLLINLLITSVFVKSYQKINLQESNKLSSNNVINKYCLSIFIFYNLLSVPTALSHEAIMFLGLPINMIVTATVIRLNYKITTTLIKTFLIYLPTIFVSCLGLLFKGNAETALIICQSWEEYRLLSDCTNKLPGALTFFDKSISDAIGLVLNVNVYRDNGKPFLSMIIALLINTIILMRLSNKTIKKSVEKISSQYLLDGRKKIDRISTSFSFKYLLIPFFCSFILYIVALDFGRWFFIVFISYALCILTPNLIELEHIVYIQNKNPTLFLFPLYKLYSQIILSLRKIYLPRKFFLFYFIVLIYVLFFMKIPHYRMQVHHLYDGGIIPQIHKLLF